MGNLKVLIAILFSLSLMMIMVLLHSFNENLFIRDAGDAITEVTNRVISTENLTNRQQAFQIVNLDEDSAKFENAIQMPFKDILLPENRKKLCSLETDIFLYSKNVSTVAKAWVILNQLDFKRVFILSDNATPEVLKYKFQPDTTIRLESQIK